MRNLNPFSTSHLSSLSVAAIIGMYPAMLKAQVEPERIDLSAFPGQIVDQVVIPIPAEIFGVLDKIGDPDWRGSIVHVERSLRVGDRAFLALFFGSLVAEGFISVQAESSDDIQKIGKRSLELAEALGLEHAVKAHSLTVIESAKDGEWDQVRRELDKTQQTVRDTMTKQRDQELSGLVSLGGWLRGTNVLTALIAEDYTRDKAELLDQPDLVRHFRELIAGIRGPVGKSRKISEIDKGLSRIEALLRENDVFDVDTVRQLSRISNEMLMKFYFEPKG